MEGGGTPSDYDPNVLMAASGPVSSPTPDTGGPIKRYLSDDPNDYVLVPGNDPDTMYALGETPVEAEPVAISAPQATSTIMPPYVSSPPPVPAIRYTATHTSAETVMPPGFYAPAASSKFIPSIGGLSYTNPAMMGYDVSKAGNIVMPLMRSRINSAVQKFAFPALFG
ncbi:MAG TPA: hypothetical protein VMC61_02605 [Methanocella sp.]|nr:hypothetical protein [Methanocella sp.]